MPNRNYSSPEYRYGFNGMEKDDNIKSYNNSYDFGARLYDPRVGRWFKPDAYEKKYPSNSTYSFGLNSPISIIDIDGNDLVIVGNKEYRRQVQQTLRDLYHQSPSARKAVMELISSDKVFVIVENQAFSNKFSPSETTKAEGYIIFNYEENGMLSPDNGLGNSSLVKAPGSSLAHELKHALDKLNGVTNERHFVTLNNPLRKNPDFGLEYGQSEYNVNTLMMDEVEAVGFESQVRVELGLTLRTHYRGEDVFQKVLSSKAYKFGSGSKQFSTPILQYNGKFNFTKYNTKNATASFIKEIIHGNNWWENIIDSKEETNVNFGYPSKNSDFPSLNSKEHKTTRLTKKK